MPANSNCAVISNDELRAMRNDIKAGNKEAQRNAAIVSAADIKRMKESMKIQTDQEASSMKKIQEEQKQQALAKSRARK